MIRTTSSIRGRSSHDETGAAFVGRERGLFAVEAKGDPEFTGNVLKRVLTEVYRRLTEVRVVYPAPKRISLEKSLSLIEGFVADLSGGDRLLALTSALFAVIGKRFRLYSDVKRASITSADAATGMLAE